MKDRLNSLQALALVGSHQMEPHARKSLPPDNTRFDLLSFSLNTPWGEQFKFRTRNKEFFRRLFLTLFERYHAKD